MKLTVILIFAGTLATYAISYSQKTPIDLQFNNPVSLYEIFDDIEKKSEFIFIYDETLLSDIKRSVCTNNELIEPILQELLSGTGISYKIFDRQVVLWHQIPSKVHQITSSFEVVLPLENSHQQSRLIDGSVVDSNGDPVIGATVVLKGATLGITTNLEGKFQLTVPADAKILVVSYIGMKTQEIDIQGRNSLNIVLENETIGLDEVVVVGYGTQKKSDITGTVTSLPQERLEKAPNINVAQAIQGSTSGVMVQTSSATAKPTENFLIRGRNSITASNSPLVVIDGIPGNIWDVNPSDVKSIEILKDASASAIYGSRSANGVILITTKSGEGKTKISYDGYYSIQEYVNLPDYMTGDEFYNYKLTRDASTITNSEKAIYDAGTWVNWADLTMRTGASQQHKLSVSGSSNKTSYYISGTLLDVKGLVINDDYLRGSGRINLDTKFGSWLSIGTNTSLTYEDQSGQAPSNPFGGDGYGMSMNPLATPYDNDGNLTIYPWPEDIYFDNPLAPILYDDLNKTYTVITNNHGLIDFPFVKGLSYRLNTGVRLTFGNTATYRGRNTKVGLEALGSASTNRSISENYVIENILNYQREFGSHNIFITGLYSYEEGTSTSNSVYAISFPHDFLGWYAANEASSKSLSYYYSNSVLISQMARVNYVYDARYLLTMSFRRDGYSGFGEENKWGLFPALALGWNLSNEMFFPWKDLFNQLKLRASWGKNGNQAVSPYNTISRLTNRNNLNGSSILTGYFPSVLGQDKLGWETSETINLGLDFGILNNRISGDINIYTTNTTGLLLSRSISSVHGISTIVDNIGHTRNKGLEFSLNSKNITSTDFTWSTIGNIGLMKNEIVSLYGLLDKDGNEIDDINNNWFIGQPILVTFDYAYDGVWQLDEADEAATWGSKPGYVKIKDLNGDGKLDPDNDRKILGHTDPNVMWGITNVFTYKNFKLNIFIHGIHGIKMNNPLLNESKSEIRRNVLDFNFWTPDNPTNDRWMNQYNAYLMGGRSCPIIEDASFVRIKDISLSYDFSKKLIEKMGINNVNLYVTVRNLHTFTKWTGLDPELLNNQQSTPMQKTYLFGLQFGF